MKPVRLFVAVGASGALLLGGATVASAGAQVTAHMVATPNPAEVGDTVTVQNDVDGTCIGPVVPEAVQNLEPVVVTYFVVNPDGSETDDINVSPDDDGNWSGTFVADMEGTYTVEAQCVVDDGDAGGSGLAPQAIANFFYEDLDIVVAQAAPTPAQPLPEPSTPTPPPAADTSAQTAQPKYTG